MLQQPSYELTSNPQGECEETLISLPSANNIQQDAGHSIQSSNSHLRRSEKVQAKTLHTTPICGMREHAASCNKQGVMSGKRWCFKSKTGNSFHSWALVKADAIWFLNPHLHIVTVSENVCWYLCYAEVILIINYSSTAYGAFSKEPAETSPPPLTETPVLIPRGPALCYLGAARALPPVMLQEGHSGLQHMGLSCSSSISHCPHLHLLNMEISNQPTATTNLLDSNEAERKRLKLYREKLPAGLLLTPSCSSSKSLSPPNCFYILLYKMSFSSQRGWNIS